MSVQFTRDSARRIADTVRKVEQQTTPQRGHPLPPNPTRPHLRVKLLEDLAAGADQRVAAEMYEWDPTAGTGGDWVLTGRNVRGDVGDASGEAHSSGEDHVVEWIPRYGWAIGKAGTGGAGGDTGSCDCLSDLDGAQTTTHCSGAVDAWEFDASAVMDELGCTLTSGDKTAVNFDPDTPDIYNSRDFVDCGYDSAKWELDLSVGLMPGEVELRLVHDDPAVDVRYRNAYYWRCEGRNWMVPTVNKLPGPDSPTLCAICLDPVLCSDICKDGINLRHVKEWEVTIAGVTGVSCPTECEGINGTWRLQFGSEPVECKSWVWGAIAGNPSMSLTIATDGQTGDTGFALRITTYRTNGPCGTSNHGYKKLVTKPADKCIDTHVLTDEENVSGESCSNWPATLTITPIT